MKLNADQYHALLDERMSGAERRTVMSHNETPEYMRILARNNLCFMCYLDRHNVAADDSIRIGDKDFYACHYHHEEITELIYDAVESMLKNDCKLSDNYSLGDAHYHLYEAEV